MEVDLVSTFDFSLLDHSKFNKGWKIQWKIILKWPMQLRIVSGKVSPVRAETHVHNSVCLMGHYSREVERMGHGGPWYIWGHKATSGGVGISHLNCLLWTGSTIKSPTGISPLLYPNSVSKCQSDGHLSSINLSLSHTHKSEWGLVTAIHPAWFLNVHVPVPTQQRTLHLSPNTQILSSLECCPTFPGPILLQGLMDSSLLTRQWKTFFSMVQSGILK